ncbi:SLAIN motif-containing protein 2-like isoform X3 [Tubulanus polymorphus]|uniref:SLAIN motif-containing protein 2-like isoform X3 n=1 Tax=Tubulanus polymorphus TaxID=672921 RepID=UPI003DA4FD37
MDGYDATLDPESEVKKLQELVKKLERQNEILRNKQTDNNVNNTTTRQQQQDLSILSDFENQNTSLDIIDKQIIKPKYTLNNDCKNVKQDTTTDSTSLESVDLIDVDCSFQNEDDEENWLYKSPKGLSPSQKSQTPYKWLREEFEHPSPEIETCRRSLVYKLEEVTRGRVSRSSSSHTLASLSSPVSAPYNTLGDSTNTPKTNGVPIIKQPLVAGLGLRNDGAGDTDVDLSPDSIWSDIGTRVDTGTFTRSKKSRPRISDYNYPANNVDSVSPSDNGSDSGDKKPETTILDVQTLAKMQEESLRQSFSPMVGSRKSSRSKLGGGGFYLSSQNDDAQSSHSSNRSSPCRFDSDVHYVPQHRKNSINSRTSSNNSLNSGSNESSPSESPYSSNQYLTEPPSIVTPRRSLPNLKSSGLRPNYSDSKLSHMRRATSPAQNLTRPLGQTGRRSPASSINGRLSPSGQTTPARGLRQPSTSPSTTARRPGIPSPKKVGIPRPSGMTTPTKRGIPVARSSFSGASSPRTRSVSPNQRSGNPTASMSSLPVTTYRKDLSFHDDSWKEGCF